jgi:hypothetical protein
MNDYAQIAKHFARETAGHQMTTLHEDGLYRHLRFMSPDGSGYRFDLITWPNRLTFHGEPGTYVFSVWPTEDMFNLFRDSSVGEQPNFGYWHEKAVAWSEDILQFSEDRFNEKVTEELEKAEEFFPGVTSAWVEKTEGFAAEYNTENDETAREALSSFEYLPEGQYGEAWRFRYTSAWDLIDFDWRYLWACHAIVWGIGQYDAARQAVAA